MAFAWRRRINVRDVVTRRKYLADNPDRDLTIEGAGAWRDLDGYTSFFFELGKATAVRESLNGGEPFNR